MIKIRLSRAGRKLAPVYTIVATNSRSPRDSKHLEKLGQYNPSSTPNLMNLKVDSIKEWISKGALMSETVGTLLKQNNIKLD